MAHKFYKGRYRTHYAKGSPEYRRRLSEALRKAFAKRRRSAAHKPAPKASGDMADFVNVTQIRKQVERRGGIAEAPTRRGTPEHSAKMREAAERRWSKRPSRRAATPEHPDTRINYLTIIRGCNNNQLTDIGQAVLAEIRRRLKPTP